MSDVAPPPKGQMVLDRLKKRLEGYRNHHDEVKPLFDHTINGVNDEQKQQTLVLRQRFIESKAKKGSKNKGDKNKQEGSQNNSSKSQKRQIEDGSSSEHGNADGYEPSKKLANSTGNFTSPAKSRSKVKFHPGGGGAPGDNRAKNGYLPPPPQHLPMHPVPPMHPQAQDTSGTFKQEPLPSSSSGFVGLDQCAAALEKDGTDLINADIDLMNDLISEISELNSAELMKDFDFGDDNDDKSDTLGSLSNSTNTPGVNNSMMDHHAHPALTPITPNSTNSPMHLGHNQNHGHVKIEGDMGPGHGMGMMTNHQCAGPSPAPATTASPLASQLNTTGGTPPYMFDMTGSPGTNPPSSAKSGRVPPSLSGSSMQIDSPAAQTLKQMAEQHQHKQKMGGASTPNSFKNMSPARSPFNEYSGQGMNNNDFMGASSNVNVNSVNNGGNGSSQPFQGAANVKQEVFSPTTQTNFSPGFPPVDNQHGGVKRQPTPQMNHGGGGNRMGQQQVLSPVNKSFSSQGMEPSSMMPGQSFLPRPQSNPNVGSPSSYPPYSNAGGGVGQMVHPAAQQQQLTGRCSPSGPMDPSKGRMGQPQPQPQQYYYQNPNSMEPAPQYDSSNQGQTINFTQQHLRVGGGPQSMAPRMTVQPNANRIPPPRPQQAPNNPQQIPNSPQQQMMVRHPQHNMGQGQHQQMGGMIVPPPGMMNRFPGSNSPTRGMQPGQTQQMTQKQRPMQPQQSQPMYSGGGQQMGMGGGMPMGPGPSSMANMHNMRQMSPYNGNHNPMMGTSAPQQTQSQPQMQRGDWMGQQQQYQMRQGPQGLPRPSMQMGYHQLPVQAQHQPCGSSGVMMGGYNNQGIPTNGANGGIMPPQSMGGYNPQIQQQQQMGGFNNKGHGPPHPPPPNYPGNNQSYVPMKNNNPMQQQQPMYQQQVKSQQQQMSMTNDISIDQMLKNITEESQFGSGTTSDIFQSIDTNYSSILDNL